MTCSMEHLIILSVFQAVGTDDISGAPLKQNTKYVFVHVGSSSTHLLDNEQGQAFLGTTCFFSEH